MYKELLQSNGNIEFIGNVNGDCNIYNRVSRFGLIILCLAGQALEEKTNVCIAIAHLNRDNIESNLSVPRI